MFGNPLESPLENQVVIIFLIMVLFVVENFAQQNEGRYY